MGLRLVEAQCHLLLAKTTQMQGDTAGSASETALASKLPPKLSKRVASALRLDTTYGEIAPAVFLKPEFRQTDSVGL